MSSCLVCKAPVDGRGICNNCKSRMWGRGRKGKAPEPVREEHEGLSQLEKVMEEDRKKVETQTRKRGKK